jgi:cytochrome b6-f complex iron-sulfur subunit
VAAVSIDRALIDGQVADGGNSGSQELTPSVGRWVQVAASADLTDGVMRPFDVGSVIGFVRRVDGKPEAVSGVCTHQGCRLWFDAPDDRLRCPCHSTSFTPTGLVVTHQLPIAPKPLPTLMVREQGGVIEVFVPATPHQSA